jgi:hypothetical protein
LAIATPFNRAWLVLFLVKIEEDKKEEKLRERRMALSASEDASETAFRSYCHTQD